MDLTRTSTGPHLSSELQEEQKRLAALRDPVLLRPPKKTLTVQNGRARYALFDSPKTRDLVAALGHKVLNH